MRRGRSLSPDCGEAGNKADVIESDREHSDRGEPAPGRPGSPRPLR